MISCELSIEEFHNGSGLTSILGLYHALSALYPINSDGTMTRSSVLREVALSTEEGNFVVD